MNTDQFSNPCYKVKYRTYPKHGIGVFSGNGYYLSSIKPKQQVVEAELDTELSEINRIGNEGDLNVNKGNLNGNGNKNKVNKSELNRKEKEKGIKLYCILLGLTITYFFYN